MDLDERRTYAAGEEVALSKLEFELLSYFIENKHIVLNRDQLLEDVWKDEAFKQEKTVNVTINRLRKKIDPNKIAIIPTVLLLKSAGMARYIDRNIKHISTRKLKIFLKW